MGLTALEAMASGCAVIVPEEGGAKSFARHKKNSIIVDTSSKKECIKALTKLIQDTDLRKNLQQTAIEDVCNFFPEKAAYNILETIFEDKD